MGPGRVYHPGGLQDNGSTSRTLVERLQRNPHDLEAGARFVCIYAPFVERLCRAPGRQSADVEEIVFIVLYNAINNLESFEFRPGRRSLRPWLHKIARHECANSARRQRTLGLPAGDMLEEPDPESQPAIVMAEAEWASFQAAYRLVCEEWQGDPQTIDAFDQTVVQDRKPSEVAGELGVTVEFVYRAAYRVRQRIQQVLREAGALDDLDEPSL